MLINCNIFRITDILNIDPFHADFWSTVCILWGFFTTLFILHVMGILLQEDVHSFLSLPTFNRITDEQRLQLSSRILSVYLVKFQLKILFMRTLDILLLIAVALL
jgi:hypothetical protein